MKDERTMHLLQPVQQRIGRRRHGDALDARRRFYTSVVFSSGHG